jgi:flagellar motor switch protein FliM
MEKVLSQEEISALFSAMSSEGFRQENIPERCGSAIDPEEKVSEQMPFGHDTGLIADLVMPLQIAVSGELRGSNLTINDFLKMSVGDVIRLKNRIGDPMVLCVGGVPKFIGRILRRRGKKVFSISGRIDG